MIFAHATKTGKAQTALFELARMVIHGHLMQRILTPMRSALVLVFVIERLASASALQVSLAMLANAVLAQTIAMVTVHVAYSPSSRQLFHITSGTLSKFKRAFAMLVSSTQIAHSDVAQQVMIH